MSQSPDITKYDEVLTSILVSEKSILGFLSSIFGFLARRTDFYYVPTGAYENMGFPPGVAEELVIKVLRTCDPKSWKGPNGAQMPFDLDNEIMCSTVAQEVEVLAEGDNVGDDEGTTTEPEKKQSYNEATTIEPTKKRVEISEKSPQDQQIQKLQCDSPSNVTSTSKAFPENYKPPEIPIQKNSDTYNGAEREKYLWSQNIMELDVTVKLPPDIKSSKDLKVTINSSDICVVCQKNGTIIIKDSLPYKIKIMDSFWSISEGKLVMHLEKVQERWWNKLLDSEEAIDLDKIDCSRPLDDLPEDHVAKVREMQWNQERKMQGLPTSDEIRNMDVLKRAWNAPGSPFVGQEFDPSILNNSSHTIGSFSGQK